MKQLEMTRDDKKELWREFDAGHAIEQLPKKFHAADPTALKKQHALWSEYRQRNPKRT